MRVALDTNRLTDLLANDQELADFLETCSQVGIPLPVLAEYEAGVFGGTRTARGEAALTQLFQRPTVELILPSRETSRLYARLQVQLKRAGKPIPINDVWIAALCLEHNLILITRDRHFAQIPQLQTR